MEPRKVLDQMDGDVGLYLDKIRHCLGVLTQEQVWWRPNRRSNSIGNLVLHLCGNLSQWVLEGLGGRPYERKRPLEFSADRAATSGELVDRLTTIVRSCREVLSRVSDAELAAPLTIQGEATDGLGALLHVWEHMSYHTGQIVLLTKQQIADDVELEFYPDLRGE